MKRFGSMTWWVLLAAWFAAATAPALTAISAFTQLQELGITVNGHQAYLGDDPLANGRFAAGYVTDPVFRITDIAQYVIAGCVLLVLMCTRGRPTGGRSRTTLVCFGIAAVLIVMLAVWITPNMNDDLAAYREAAEAGRVAEADAHLEAFNTLHPFAERMHGLRALAVLGMIAASGFAASGNPNDRRESTPR